MSRPAWDRKFRFCRSCFGHIAGEVGVAVARHAMHHGYLRRGTGEKRLQITADGVDWLQSIGLADVKPRHATICIDLTEKQPHLAGPLGLELLRHFRQSCWLVPSPRLRTLHMTEAGLGALTRHFGQRSNLLQTSCLSD